MFWGYVIFKVMGLDENHLWKEENRKESLGQIPKY